jgi:hypothetical protein
MVASNMRKMIFGEVLSKKTDSGLILEKFLKISRTLF